MPPFLSYANKLDDVRLPMFNGIRVMMMPFHIHDPLGSLPWRLLPWLPTLERMTRHVGLEGVGYLTIDEAVVPAGEAHRRPGLHVDGVGEDGGVGGWGGGGGYAGREGMLMVSSHVGCCVHNQTFSEMPRADGDCDHLADECNDGIALQPGELWWCSSLCVHEALPMAVETRRQFCRISYPSSAPWHEGYTPNPLGIMPAGPIARRRDAQMSYRP